MKVLVTGGCGFLGSNIAASYLTTGATVAVIDALYRTGGDANLRWLRSLGGKLVYSAFDIAEQAAVDDFFRREGPFDYVCHLAGQVAMTSSLSDPRRDFSTNALGTFNILEAVRNYSREALVAYSSTNKVYGDLRHLNYSENETRYTVPQFPFGFNEALSLDFASPYGCSKGAADQYVHDWYRNFGIPTVVFRHSSIYGSRQFATFDQGWIGWFCTKAAEQADALSEGRTPEPFSIAGSGKQVRDVLHATDLIALYRSAYDRRHVVAGEIFNIGGGIDNSLSLLELFALLADLLGLDRSLVFRRTGRRQSDQDFFVADIDKARRIIGWSPAISARSGIGQMLEWLPVTKQ